MADSRVFPAIIKATYDPSGGFPKMVQDAQNASGQIKRQFESDFGEIANLAKTALAIPRNAGGSLDLNVGQYKLAADNARLHATALREIATAAASAAKSQGDTSRATQTYIQAASAAAREAEEQARAINATATSYERLQAELNRTKSAAQGVVAQTNLGTTANGALTNSQRAMRQATIQSGQQFQDLAISIGSGQRASTVLAQQLPQLAFALSGLDGKVGSVARFFAGPWGVALAIGAFALGPLIDNLFKTEKGADDAARSSRTFGEVLADQTSTTAELTKAVMDYNREQARANQTVAAGISVQDAAIKKNLEEARSLREKIKATLESVEAQATLAQVSSGGNALTAIGAYLYNSGPRGGLFAAIAEQDKLIKALEVSAQESRGQVAAEFAKMNTDEKHAIEERYKLRFTEAENTIKNQKALNAEFLRLEIAKQAELDALSKKANANSERDTRTRMQVLADFRRELEERGVKTISGFRTAAQQNALFRQGDTPADGYKIPSRHQTYRALDIDKNTFNERAIYEAGQAAGIKGLRILTESRGRKHLDFTGSNKPGTVDDKQAERYQRDIERAAKAAEALQNNLDGITSTVTRIGSEFDRQPRFIDRATVAAEKLRQVIAEIDKNLAGTDLTADQRAKLEEERKIAQNTLQTEIPRAIRQPFDDITKQAERELELQTLRLRGREVEADLLQGQYDLMQRYGAETEALATALATAGITKEQYLTQLDIQKVLLTNRDIEQERLERLGQTIDDRMNRLRELREEAIATISEAAATGDISFKNLFDTINRQFADQFARQFFEQFLGGAFQSEEDRLRNLKNQADGQLVVSTTRVIDAFNELGSTAFGLATGTPVANDNLPNDPSDIRQQAEIVVSGVRAGNKDFARLITKSLESLLGEGSVLAADIGSAITGALEGAQLGGFIGSAFGSGGGRIGRGIGALLGGANSILGPSSPLNGVMAALPQVGAVLQASSAISSLLGNDQKKGGKILGTFAPFLVALFGSSLRGSASIGNVNGSLGITGTRGNSRSRREAASSSANTVIDQLTAMAEQLGVTINPSGVSASIGIRKKNYILDPTGQGRTRGPGTINFGRDEAGAIAAARALALDVINDGLFVGLRAGAQKLLSNAKTLEAGLEKALKFQSVFDRLAAFKDPFGSAISSLNKEFTGLIALFNEAGASAQEFAELEELYGYERAKIIKEQSEALTGSLRSLIEDLTQGENGLALRDRLSNIRAQFDPLANTIRGGGTVDYERFSELARQLIDVQRQISGSQVDYFAVFNEILGLSQQALAGQQNVISIGTGATSPFSGAAAPSNTSTPVVGAIMTQTGTLVASLAAVQAQIAALGNGGGGSTATPLNNNFLLHGTSYW